MDTIRNNYPIDCYSMLFMCITILLGNYSNVQLLQEILLHINRKIFGKLITVTTTAAR